MESPPAAPSPFERLGPTVPLTPLVVSVPHGGRDYPPALLARSALPVETLARLEDRHVDALAAGLPALGHTVFVARRARAWIDLNRDERELDAAMIAPPPRPAALLPTAKVRGGLGLIPRRVPGAGEISVERWAAAEIADRIATVHRPWHAAIGAALAAARRRFGIALLLDLHSMPPLATPGGQPPPRLVLGDRHGRAAGGHIVARLLADAGRHDMRVARNAPYAGGHTLDRHGRPANGVHAIQLEVDRSLYLGPDLRSPGEGLHATVRLVEALAGAFCDLAMPGSVAAE